MNAMKLLIISGLFSGLAACSDNESNQSGQKETHGEHIWKHQTDTLKTSKDVAKQLQKNLNLQQQEIEDNK